ncbi:DUF6961 family protein [Sphingomonas jatrophae]|uniref:Uncharacterized protein n=1 Tax=Sphingomonas jatrophae TaxID=1166337 RepID=A0A1I6M7P0_9SPHN|nr:hypothetical protein [Sphingomonas jatrophae]SFS11716.1 hypothetical protein SAMN05192580_3627 [Sphingomonas jatrophae]
MHDQDQWAEALHVDACLGDLAPLWIGERIAHFAALGDTSAVRRYTDMAAIVAMLAAPGRC